MSQLSEQSRLRAKEKVKRITAPNKGDIDASGWREPTDEKGGVQTGPRPVSRRQFRSGGKVEGEKTKMHAGRKVRLGNAKPSLPMARAAGGRTKTDGGLINTDVKEENQSRDGDKHIGGMKKGGRTKRAEGGRMPDYTTARTGNLKAAHAAATEAPRGSVGAKFKGAMAQELTNRPPFSRTAKMVGGPMMGRPEMQPMSRSTPPPQQGVRPRPAMGLMRKDGGKTMHGKSCVCSKCSGGAVGKKSGGALSVTDGAVEGTRPEGGRLARKAGGRAKKGTNINIIIAPGAGQPKPPMPMPMAPPPGPGGPVGLHQAPPGPPMMPPGGAPPMGPMGHKAGGKVYPIDSGAGGGLGRLEKARAYG